MERRIDLLKKIGKEKVKMLCGLKSNGVAGYDGIRGVMWPKNKMPMITCLFGWFWWRIYLNRGLNRSH